MIVSDPIYRVYTSSTSAGDSSITIQLLGTKGRVIYSRSAHHTGASLNTTLLDTFYFAYNQPQWRMGLMTNMYRSTSMNMANKVAVSGSMYWNYYTEVNYYFSHQ